MKSLQYFFILFISLGLSIGCKGPSGEKADVSEAGEVSQATGVDYTVNTATSSIMWEGAKVTGTHNGTVNISEGTVAVEDGVVTGGSFTMDMTSIDVKDLEGEWKQKLETHLKGTGEEGVDDFFNVKQYPTATFEITKLTALSNDTEASHLVYGNLTMKNVSKEVGFKAKVDIMDGKVTVTSPQFTIDRTQWGIKFRSSSFFDDLKDNAINNEIGLKVQLEANAPAS